MEGRIEADWGEAPIRLDEDGFGWLEPELDSSTGYYKPIQYEGDGRYDLRLYFGRINGQIECVGLSILGFRGSELLDHTGPLDTQRLRALPLGTVIGRARADIAESIELNTRQDPVFANNWKDHAGAWQDSPKRPGRPASLTDEQLTRIVVRNFLNAPRGRQEAVRQALQEAGVLPGNGLHGEVTTEQAKKAIALARKHNLFPKEER